METSTLHGYRGLFRLTWVDHVPFNHTSRSKRYVAPRWLQMAAATVGGALECFDILMYGYLAVTLSNVFFPARNSTISLLLVFGSFGLPYVVRPLGAAVLGAYADRRGRKKHSRFRLR
jgi:MFS transporter, MHS family, proline/betaine transporter